MKHKVFIVLLILVFIALTVVFYLKYQSFSVEKKLMQEVNEVNTILLNKNYSTDDMNNVLNRVVTTGDYAIVEKSYKEYIKDYLNDFDMEKVINNINNNNKIVDCLSIDNYKTDGKEFKNTTEYLNSSVEFLEETKEIVNNYLNKDKAYSYIEKKNLSQHYIDLYRNDIIGDFEEVSHSFTSKIDEMISLYHKVENVIKLLKDNKNNWQIVDDKVEFIKEELYGEYSNLLEQIR